MRTNFRRLIDFAFTFAAGVHDAEPNRGRSVILPWAPRNPS
jgi:hypothetical protein